MNPDFERCTELDVADLIAAYPLAWIVSGGPDFQASLMPMLLDLDPAGHPVSLTGHFPKSSAQYPRLCEDPRALFLFQGPHGYLSPALVRDKNWAPTWNFAAVRIVAEVRFDEGLTDESLERLVTHMEAGQAEPWRVAAMGPRYRRLREAVIGFRAPILSVTARCKLGQDERPEVLAEIMEHLDDKALVRWMSRFYDRVEDSRR